MRRQLLGASGKGLEVPGVVRPLVRSVLLMSLLSLWLQFPAQHVVMPCCACKGVEIFCLLTWILAWTQAGQSSMLGLSCSPCLGKHIISPA